MAHRGTRRANVEKHESRLRGGEPRRAEAEPPSLSFLFRLKFHWTVEGDVQLRRFRNEWNTGCIKPMVDADGALGVQSPFPVER